MNLLLVLISSILLLNVVVSRQLSSIDIDSTLDDLKLVSEEDSDMQELASDDIMTMEEFCEKVLQFTIKTLKDPKFNLTPEQLRLIPTPNKMSISEHQHLCPPEYDEWIRNAEPLEVSLTPNQRETIKTKINQFAAEIAEKNT
jgi:hypothetical protein